MFVLVPYKLEWEKWGFQQASVPQPVVRSTTRPMCPWRGWHISGEHGALTSVLGWFTSGGEGGVASVCVGGGGGGVGDLTKACVVAEPRSAPVIICAISQWQEMHKTNLFTTITQWPCHSQLCCCSAQCGGGMSVQGAERFRFGPCLVHVQRWQ